MRRESRFWLWATLALLAEGGAVYAFTVNGWMLLAVGLHVGASLACRNSVDRSEGVYRDTMLVGALCVPVLGPVTALVLLTPPDGSAVNAHAFFENYETEVRAHLPVPLPDRDSKNATMSFQEVLHHGSIDHRRNALRKLAERGEPIHLAMLRRCLSHTDVELRLGAFAEIDRLLRKWELRLSDLETIVEHDPGDADAALQLSAARREYATSGLLDREMAGLHLAMALDCCVRARTAFPEDPSIAVEEALVCLARNDLAGAKRAVARVSGDGTERADVCIVRAQIAFRTRQFESIALEVQRLEDVDREVPYWMRSLAGLQKEEWEVVS